MLNQIMNHPARESSVGRRTPQALDRRDCRAVRSPLGRPFSRRLFLAGATAFGLTACGVNGSNPDGPSGDSSAGFPVTLPGKEGTATIPTKPERVVALGFQRDGETAVALGVVPVAMSENTLFPNRISPWAEAKLPEPRPELLNTAESFPFEKIASLRPDVLLATDSYVLTDHYERLSQIAPTVSYLAGPDSDTWQQRTTLIGQALGLADQAEGLITETENLISQAAADNPSFAGKTFSISYVYSGEIRGVLEADTGAQFLKQLGLQIAPALAAQPVGDTPGRTSISPENLAVLEADVMIAAAPSEEDRRFFESTALFPQLDAVQNGAYIPVELPIALAMSFPSPLSIPYALDGIVPEMARVLG